MSKTYSREGVLTKVRNLLAESKIDNLYQQKCINWKGKANDKNEYSSDIIAGELLLSVLTGNFKTIKCIQRQRSYNPRRGKRREKTNNQKVRRASNRAEERFARSLYGAELPNLGKVLNYQVPLKEIRNNKGVGKVDLITLNKKKVYLVELKGPMNENDTLLRSVLEIWTYKQQLDKKKLLDDYKQPLETDIDMVVLLFPGTLAFQEFHDLKSRPNLQALIKQLGVKIFIFEPCGEFN